MLWFRLTIGDHGLGKAWILVSMTGALWFGFALGHLPRIMGKSGGIVILVNGTSDREPPRPRERELYLEQAHSEEPSRYPN